MYKKAWCTCEVVVLLIKPIVFLTFSLPSASLDLKDPIYWLTKQIITNTNWNHFSRSYENRSIDRANTNMSNRGRRGTRIVYYSSILAHSLKVSLFCNVISPQSPASGLYCLVSHWNYDKPVQYFRVMPGHSPLATTAWHERHGIKWF